MEKEKKKLPYKCKGLNWIEQGMHTSLLLSVQLVAESGWTENSRLLKY